MYGKSLTRLLPFSSNLRRFLNRIIDRGSVEKTILSAAQEEKIKALYSAGNKRLSVLKNLHLGALGYPTPDK